MVVTSATGTTVAVGRGKGDEKTKEDMIDAEQPAEIRKTRLAIGAVTVQTAKALVSFDEVRDRRYGGANASDNNDDKDPMEIASRMCGTASVRTSSSRRWWHRSESTASSIANSANKGDV